MAEDRYLASINGFSVAGTEGWLDIEGADHVQIQISSDGRTIWINAPDCKFRICGIRHGYTITDMCAVERERFAEQLAGVS